MANPFLHFRDICPYLKTIFKSLFINSGIFLPACADDTADRSGIDMICGSQKTMKITPPNPFLTREGDYSSLSPCG